MTKKFVIYFDNTLIINAKVLQKFVKTLLYVKKLVFSYTFALKTDTNECSNNHNEKAIFASLWTDAVFRIMQHKKQNGKDASHRE